MTTRHFALRITDTTIPLTQVEDRIVITSSCDEWHRSHDTPGTITATIILPYGPSDPAPAGVSHPGSWPGQFISVLTTDPSPLPDGVIARGWIESVAAHRLNPGPSPRWSYTITAADPIAIASRAHITLTRERETWQERWQSIIDACHPDIQRLIIPTAQIRNMDGWGDNTLQLQAHPRILQAVDYRDMPLVEALQRTTLGWHKLIRRLPGGLIGPSSDAIDIDLLTIDGLSWLGSAPWAQIRTDQIEDVDDLTCSVTTILDTARVHWRDTWMPNRPEDGEVVWAYSHRGPLQRATLELWSDHGDEPRGVIGPGSCAGLTKRIMRYIDDGPPGWSSSTARITLRGTDSDWHLLATPTRMLLDPTDPCTDRMFLIPSATVTLTTSLQTLDATLISSEVAGVRPIRWDELNAKKWVIRLGVPSLGVVTFALASTDTYPLNLWRTKYTESVV